MHYSHGQVIFIQLLRTQPKSLAQLHANQSHCDGKNTLIPCPCGTHKAPGECLGDRSHYAMMCGAGRVVMLLYRVRTRCIRAIDSLISTLVLCLAGVSRSTTKATQKAFVATQEMIFFVSPRKLFVISKRHQDAVIAKVGRRWR